MSLGNNLYFGDFWCMIFTHVFDLLQKLNKPHILKCSYQHYGRPELFIRPAKEEVVFHRPYIIMYRQILSDQEMSIVKGIAAPRVSITHSNLDLLNSKKGCP